MEAINNPLIKDVEEKFFEYGRIESLLETLARYDLNLTKNTVKNGTDVNNKLCFGGAYLMKKSKT